MLSHKLPPAGRERDKSYNLLSRRDFVISFSSFTQAEIFPDTIWSIFLKTFFDWKHWYCVLLPSLLLLTLDYGLAGLCALLTPCLVSWVRYWSRVSWAPEPGRIKRVMRGACSRGKSETMARSGATNPAIMRSLRTWLCKYVNNISLLIQPKVHL